MKMQLVTTLALTSLTAMACGSGNGGAGGSPESMGNAGEAAGGSSAGSSQHADGGDGSVVVPPNCRPTADTDQPDEDFADSNCDGIDGEIARAVFVSPEGYDDAPGTIDEPVLSVGRGVELAATGERSVYVCNGTYRENLVVTTPAAIYGGYDCGRGWRRTKDWAVLESGAGVPLIVQGVDGRVHIDRLALRALDGLAPGQSSQAAAVVDSTDVSFTRVEFQAGNGAAGKAGQSGESTLGIPANLTGDRGDDTSTTDCFTPDTPGGSPGYECGRYASGGSLDSITRSCGNWATRGGKGGAGGNIWLAQGKPGCFKRGQDSGDSGLPGQFHTGDGNWKNVATADLGNNGAEGDDGLPAPYGVGSIVDGLYTASNAGRNGTSGKPGFPGKGGDGGLSAGHGGDVCGDDYRTGSGGGQGGLGGCYGGLALGGSGGGGAIALVIVGSRVRLAFPRFLVGDGGAGAGGATGGRGESGGIPGAAGNAMLSIYQGKSGQAGGKGGDGGDGGPGGGGPAIAVLFTGTAPEVSDASYEIGAPGSGGTAVSGQNGPAGVTGEIESLDELVGGTQ